MCQSSWSVLEPSIRNVALMLTAYFEVVTLILRFLPSPAIRSLTLSLLRPPTEHNLNLINIADEKKPSEWAGLCVLDREGKARKVVVASHLVVKDTAKNLRHCTLFCIISNLVS